MLHSFSMKIQSFLLILALSTCVATAFDLQAKVEQLEKNYVKMKEHLEAKMIDLETKVGRLEAKVEKQDSLLAVLKKGHKPLKENVDINEHRRHNATLRTCHEIHVANPSYPSGMYWIDPDGQGIGDPPIHVHCNMEARENDWDEGEPLQPGSTFILHDSESKMDIGHCTEPGCYSRPIKYYASHRQIEALIQLSTNCAQYFAYYCKKSPLNHNGIAYAWYNGKDGKRYEFSNWMTTCDKLSDTEQIQKGVTRIHNNHLPYTRFHFSNPFKGSGQYRVSRLRCHGNAKTEAMPASCEDLWRMGHTFNGIYSIMGAKHIENVFCQFDKRPNEQGHQKWIGYVDVKSKPTYFYVQKKRSFSARDVAIPFEVEKVNVGNAMDLKTGTFTAPRDGMYFFSFTGLASTAPTKETAFSGVGLFLNAIQVGRTWVHEADVTFNHDRPLTLQLTLKLKTNDRVWLQITGMAEASLLFDNHHGHNHFTVTSSYTHKPDNLQTSAIVLTGFLISLAVQGRANELDKNNGIMVPDKEQQVFTALANISVTCIFIHTVEIKWNIPDYLTKTPGISAMSERLNFTYEKNETHVWSTMTLIKARARDTGYYECYLPLFNEVRVKQYIYVYNRRDAVIMEEELVKFRFEMGEDVLIPCNPTHPDVNVQLKRSPQLVIGQLSKEELQRDLLSGPSRHWFRQQYKGLRHRNVTLDDFGSYQCIGQLKNSTGKPTDKRFNLIVSGLDLIRNGSSARDPVEGSNVVLICRAYALSSPPRWTYYPTVNDSASEEPISIISESETPSELGMEINTTRLTVQGESESYYVSILKLPNVTADSPQKFGCWAMNKRDKIEQAIVSFQVTRKGSRSRHSIEKQCDYVHRSGDGVEHFDEVYSSGNVTVLTLQGTEEEVGSYACRWSNYLGQSFKNFTVTFAEEPDAVGNTVVIAVGTLTAVITLAAILIGIRLYFDKKGNLFPGAQALLRGNPKELNDHLSLDEQIEILPYDTRWEFPRHRLKLGVQLGAGCFGRVVKAQAVGVKDSEETVKTVAVKMVRSQTNVAALEALVGELKIMIHLGAHLNVVNLLGACTKSVIKGELLVIVEYCRFGNLQTYLVGHRADFVNQVDEFGNLLTDAEMQERDCSRNEGAIMPINQDEIQTSSSQANLVDQDVSACPAGSSSSSSSGEVIPGADTFGFYQQDPENQVSHSISTADLISWSFQIARGMDYLASRKVLHGDLAARNVLLADGGVAKVADFGMSRNMYYEGNYQKESQGLMPVKWMAIESLTDRRFSTQSDVWSYGVLLWEIFTLGKVPYPGMEANHELIQQLEKGYRMEKPQFAPNYFGEIMAGCWKSDPQERPSFSHIEQQISRQMESTVSDHYLNLNESYEKLNQEKVSTPANEPLGLAKALDSKKEKLNRSSSVSDALTKPIWNGISLRRVAEDKTNLDELSQQKAQICNQYV
ncbi:hypothetical protein GHT06_016152 [Daphnia sinensis]|uniref:receptor protein-tyrosine kinase n=1 Tax=Daphnia sinensis TaxID=1820382 RepID=A0AAD5PVA5_9CRUS|nr:hypothetical protein GHT06_016152 [Daphnia sinensis]